MSSKVSVEKNEYPKVTSKWIQSKKNQKHENGSRPKLVVRCLTPCTLFYLDAFVVGAALSYLGSLLLLMAFCSPYWMESYESKFSNFKNMGLWEYCFKEFRYPFYQFPTTFDGCHHIFSREYYVIREWLLPGWLMVVQFFVTMSFLLTFAALVIMSLELIRWPLKFVLQFEWVLTKISFHFIASSCKWSFCD